ncbi:host specificity factor TipJ family phage tail protein (plasmid) [Klebsiella pneumoniae]|nr:host specificity factor TipJ family phage tail protein [Klebsiella pneumoniae]UNS83641.1 host specificity factor TipJ family phage tail protein [Klebsiella pneumoniae]
MAALDTRKSKEAIDPAEKMVEWMNTLKETGFDIRGYREAADARAAELARAPAAPVNTDGPDITDVVTKAIAGLSDRKVQFTYADLLARTVGQLEAKDGVFELARKGIDAAIEREQLIPLDREKGLFTSNIHVLDELAVKALSQEVQRQNHVSVTTIDVAMTADRAWRIGMRRLMKYLHQRRTYTATTSMLGWCHDFGDHIILSDDIPTGKTQSCLIDAMIYDFQEITLHVTEPLDWSYVNPRCWIQFQDGRPSSRMLTPQRVDDFTLTVPYNDDLHPGDWIMDDPDIDLPKLLFCNSEKGARHGIVQEVAPSGDSNCQITATIDVAMTADRAWRIGMRRLMKYLHQRRTYTATTSMLGWCHDIGDHIILSDDIPTGKTQSCLIDAMIYDFQEITLHVTEPLDWSYANPRCWIQFQDGRPSSRMLTPQRVDDFTLTVPYNDDLHPEDWIMDDPDIDPPKLLFCDSEKGARHGIVQEVAPSGDSNCQITAVIDIEARKRDRGTADGHGISNDITGFRGSLSHIEAAAARRSTNFR